MQYVEALYEVHLILNMGQKGDNTNPIESINILLRCKINNQMINEQMYRRPRYIQDRQRYYLQDMMNPCKDTLCGYTNKQGT